MARNFNNSTDTYIQHYLGATYDVPVTISAWANPNQTNAADTLVSLNVGTIAEALGTSLQLRLGSSAQVAARSSTEAAQSSALSTGIYSANTWQHTAAKFAASNSRIAYLNGVGGAAQTTSRLTPNLEYLIVGRGSGGAQDTASSYNGSLAEVAVWNVALDDEEIVSLSKGVKPTMIRPDKLIAYFPLIRDVYNIINKQTSTVSGTTIVDHPRRYG